MLDSWDRGQQNITIKFWGRQRIMLLNHWNRSWKRIAISLSGRDWTFFWLAAVVVAIAFFIFARSFLARTSFDVFFLDVRLEATDVEADKRCWTTGIGEKSCWWTSGSEVDRRPSFAAGTEAERCCWAAGTEVNRLSSLVAGTETGWFCRVAGEEVEIEAETWELRGTVEVAGTEAGEYCGPSGTEVDDEEKVRDRFVKRFMLAAVGIIWKYRHFEPRLHDVGDAKNLQMSWSFSIWSFVDGSVDSLWGLFSGAIFRVIENKRPKCRSRKKNSNKVLIVKIRWSHEVLYWIGVPHEK